MTDADHIDPVDPVVDDWAPLSKEERISHPGELVDAAFHPETPAPGPSIPTVAAPQAVMPEPDPAAEQALRDLKARIANSGPSTSLVAEVLHREERQERQQRAATAQLAADAAVAQAPKQPRDPLPIEYDAGVHGRDQREEDAWFRELPADERERLHAAWAQKRQHAEANIASKRRTGIRRLVAALLVFGAVVAVGSATMWVATLCAGVCCGIWWWHAAPERFLDPLRALGCYFGAHTAAVIANGSLSPLVFVDSVLLAGFATIVGFDGEIRRSGGIDAK